MPFYYNPASLLSVQRLTSGTAYTPTPGTRCIMVEVGGGGGGSGGCALTNASQVAVSGGGSGGGYARKLYAAMTAGATYAVGSAGAAGAAGNNVGGTAGDSSFTMNGVQVRAFGGLGGAGCPAVSSALVGITVVGGNGTGLAGGGDTESEGGHGGNGFAFGVQLLGGVGGTSFFSCGAYSLVTTGSTTGQTPDNFGGGASGSCNNVSQAARAGAAGFAGVVVIWEFS